MGSDQRHRRRAGRGPSSWPGGANTNPDTLSNPDTINDTYPDTNPHTNSDTISDTNSNTDPDVHARDSRIR
jgi:hypothetical protein